jgi:tetratricopeptide (TPR) repeat protein
MILYSRSLILLILLAVLAIPPVLAVNGIELSNSTDPTENAWHDYDQAVDLANAGKFNEALSVNEKALTVSQNFPVAWANEAGILVQLGRYDDAIRAADTVIFSNISGMPNTYAASYYSKGDALRALGRISEAQQSYAKAYQLDPTLVPPDLSSDGGIPTPSSTLSESHSYTSPVPVTTQAPLSLPVPICAVLITFVCWRYGRSSGRI